jgi:predicted ATPase
MLFEDAHWIDPSTQELLGAAIDRLQSMPVLLLITYRPEFSPPWAGFGHVTTHSLNRLGGHETVGIIDSVTGGKALPADVVDQIIGKTDGVPLFVEEVTKVVLESGTLTQRGDSYILDGPLSSVMVPATLHDALLARLDRLPEAKEVAQTAACIGRVFSYEVLAAISRLDENDLREALSRLVNSELVFQRGVPPESIYTFKHALVRDTAYSSLMKVNCRRIHERLAEALEQRFQSLVAQHPEVLAHHLEQAEFTERAVKYWHQAGMQAAGRSAHAEAVTHLTRGLQLLSRLPDTEERIFQEVRLQNSLGVSLVTSAPGEEVLKAYTRARELCTQIDETSHLYTAIWGLWYYNVKRMQLETARDLSYELIELAEQSGDRELLLQGHHSAWTVLLYLGDLEACEQHATEGRQIYDPEEHRHHALLYGGHDPGVCSRYQSSISHWLLGYPDQAVERVEEAIQLARRLEQPYSEVIALSASAYIHQFRGDPARVHQAVEATLAVGHGQGFGQHRETGRFFSGWATAMEGEVESGLDTMRTSLAELKKMGANIRRTYYLSMFAELCILARRYCEAQNALAEADTLVEDFGERWWQPELHRLRGEASLAAGEASKVNDAEAWLHRSRDLARQQSAKSLELRAVLSLAKLRTRQGRREEARALVEPLVESFTEGFGTTDLAKAGEALRELS